GGAANQARPQVGRHERAPGGTRRGLWSLARQVRDYPEAVVSAPRTAGSHPVFGADGFAGRVDDEPVAAEALTVGHAGFHVTDVVVQRPAVVRDLEGAVVALDRAEERLVEAGTQGGQGVGALDGHGRPVRGTVVVAGAGALGVGQEEVERHAVLVGEELAQLRRLGEVDAGDGRGGGCLVLSERGRGQGRGG